MAIEANLQLAGVPSSLTQPDIILPSQHFGPRRSLIQRRSVQDDLRIVD